MKSTGINNRIGTNRTARRDIRDAGRNDSIMQTWMKRLPPCGILLGLALLLTACETAEPVTYASYGAAITPQDAVSVSEVWNNADLNGQKVKVKGTIRDVCQTRGCWMTIDAGKGEHMRITFRDYAYFVPKNAGGHQAVVEGTIRMEELPVETLRHYAEESGRSVAEVKAITEPEIQLSLIADGVLIAGIDAGTPAVSASGEQGHEHDAAQSSRPEETN